MIGQVVKHGRSKRDARNLHAHLMKDQNCKVEILNSVAPDLYEVMNDMALARDGSRSETAFLHISLSPSKDMTDDEMRKIASIVMQHFDAADHQAALVIHEKNRANNEGNRHAHIVLGRVSPSGAVLPAGFDKIKLETAVRIAEYELAEPPVLGRHHASSMKWLQANGREDVADWLDNSLGSNPDKPQSSMSPAKRQKVERVAGSDLATITMAVKNAWERSDSGPAFSAALHEAGLEVRPGQKSGVFVVSHNGSEIGALDRLLKEKRNVVKSKMESLKYDRETKNNTNASDGSYLQGKPSEQERSREIDPIVESFRASRTSAGRSDRANTASFRGCNIGAETSDDYDRGSGQKSRRFEQKTNLVKLDKVRLSNEAVFAAQGLKTHIARKSISKFEFQSAFNLIENHQAGWEFIKFLKNDLMCKIKEIQEKYFKKTEPEKMKARSVKVAVIRQENNAEDHEYLPPKLR